MPDDFPAAHSMDCEWFAVDRDGYVAVFDSGEAGAVPTAACIDNSSEVASQLIRLLPRGEGVHDRLGRLVPGRYEDGGLHQGWHADCGHMLFLKTIDLVR